MQRPLDIDDDNRVVTPAHILAPATTMGFGISPQCSLARVIGQLRQGIDYFWRVWTDHYLRQISVDRFKSGHPKFIELQAGDQVLVPKNIKSGRAFGRMEFKVAEVLRVLPSADNRPRQVLVRDEDGEEHQVVSTNLHLVENRVIDRRQ